MRYLIIGTGGTGGSIGSFLALQGKDVTFLSRGRNLEMFQKNGLHLKSGIKGDCVIKNINFLSAENYKGQADVIFVCVKGYSVTEILSIVKKASHKETIIIPIMNGYNMGTSISKHLNVGHALEGCIYISAFVESPGTIVQLGQLFKVVFGQKKNQDVNVETLKQVERDLASTGIVTTLSHNIERDTFKKFSFISAYAACGAYYDIEAIGMQEDTEYRKTFMTLCQEVALVGKALDLKIDVDLLQANLDILHSLTPDTTASMQKDMKAGKQYEMDGLVFEVVRLARQYNVVTPMYDKISAYFSKG